MTVIEPAQEGGYRAAGTGWELLLDRPAAGLFTFRAGKNLEIVLHGAKLDDLEESTALAGRRKLHLAEDGNEASLETGCTIPFGAEPSINRKFRLLDGVLCVTTDFVIRTSFRIRDLVSGGFSVRGGIRRFAVLRAPADGVLLPEPEWKEFAETEPGTVLYQGAEPPAALLMENEEGMIIEFAVGEDFWRWTTPSAQPFTSSDYTLTRSAEGIDSNWLLYHYQEQPDQEIPDGRNRRISFLLAWRKPKRTRKKPYADIFDMSAFRWDANQLAISPDGNPDPNVPCFASAGVINCLKKWVRRHLADAKEGDVYAIVNVRPVCCRSAAHQDRARQKILPHLTAYAVNNFKRWANKQLSLKGAKLEIVPPAKSFSPPSI